jgi:Mn2+/Fe2+ NRAMP family transporter
VQRFLRILLWSILAAAFIGPGTVTTAASAGASFGTTLAWALVFSTLATLLLQEFAARLTIATGDDLGRTLATRFPAVVRLLAACAVLIGCAAYEAGNLLGGTAGVQLVMPWSRVPVVLVAVLLSGTLLWWARADVIARLLGGIVAIMGICFGIAACSVPVSFTQLLRACVVPELPDGSTALAIGLIGTTVVPYNLFLGSALAAGHSLRDMRWGLGITIPVGGLISLAVLVVGSTLDGSMSFEALAEALSVRLGVVGPWVLGAGLFCAGFSSALTAPLAAALTWRGVFGRSDDPRWHHDGRWPRAIKLGVLVFGGAVALSGVSIVPAIVSAQVLNGLLLPIAATILWWCMRDRTRLGPLANGWWLSFLGAIVVLVTIALGARGIARVFHG